MRRTVLTVLTAAVVAALATGALAAAPKFHSVSSDVNNDGALVVSFDERGLGNDNVTYSLTGDSEATWACINRGGKNPAAANKRTFQEPVVEGETFAVKNGRVVASFVTGPPEPTGFSCPGGQRLVLASVSYTNLVLTDVTNNVSTSVPDASRTFFTV